MNIIKPRLIWKEPLEPNDTTKIDSIAIHHIQAQSATPETIHRWHLDRGWKGAGYGYYVRKDGTVYELRGTNLNAGVENENGHIVSIAFEGDYQNIDKIMPAAQFESGVALIKHLKTLVPNIKTVDGHKNWNNTSCPGQYFPLAKMKVEASKQEVAKVEEWKIQTVKDANTEGLIKDCEQWMRKADEPATVWFVLTVALNVLKIVRFICKK